jgi:hypothetical protein
MEVMWYIFGRGQLLLFTCVIVTLNAFIYLPWKAAEVPRKRRRLLWHVRLYTLIVDMILITQLIEIYPSIHERKIYNFFTYTRQYYWDWPRWIQCTHFYCVYLHSILVMVSHLSLYFPCSLLLSRLFTRILGVFLNTSSVLRAFVM